MTLARSFTAGVLGAIADGGEVAGRRVELAAPARVGLVGEPRTGGDELARALAAVGLDVAPFGDLGEVRLAGATLDLLVVWPDPCDPDVMVQLAEAPAPLVAVLGRADQALLSGLIAMGAQDVLLAPVDEAAVARACLAALRRTRGRPRPRRAPAAPVAALPGLGAAGAAVARTRLPVLIVGETGTGKSRLARMLHQTLTPSAAFVEVNVASLDGALLCSELFGHERGAFTGAHASKPGLVGAASGGTLFLDEIGELSADGQAKLLSYLDTGMYRPVGGLRELHSDARVVCATNRDLAAAVAAGRFREDLYYRLASIVVPLPALREHREQIPRLALELLEQAAGRAGVAPPGLADDTLAALAAHDWPGNVRQLRFVMERLVALHPGETLAPAALRPLLAAPTPRVGASPPPVRSLAEMELEMVRRAMDAARGNRTKAAELLGITPRGLYNKLRRAGTTFRGSE